MTPPFSLDAVEMTWLRMTGDADTSFESDMRRGSLEPVGAILSGERMERRAGRIGVGDRWCYKAMCNDFCYGQWQVVLDHRC